MNLIRRGQSNKPQSLLPNYPPLVANALERDDQFTFPVRLHKMLELADQKKYDFVVSWLEDGRSFKVHNRLIFMETIVPVFFTLTKFQSFRRQLQLYGFRRINDGPNKGAYFHPSFIRDQPDLYYNIRRQVVSRTRSSKKMSNSSPCLQETTDGQQHMCTNDDSSSGMAPLELTSMDSNAMKFPVCAQSDIAFWRESSNYDFSSLSPKQALKTPEDSWARLTPITLPDSSNEESYNKDSENASEAEPHIANGTQMLHQNGWLQEHNRELLFHAFALTNYIYPGHEATTVLEITMDESSVVDGIISVFGSTGRNSFDGLTFSV